MKQINIPLCIQTEKLETSITDEVSISRVEGDEKEMIDNIIELVVFTPRGSFSSDPDFGFDYWNHEFSNVSYNDFNNGHTSDIYNLSCKGISKSMCERSITQSLATYVPQLKNVTVEVKLFPIVGNERVGQHVHSKCSVSINISGIIEDSVGVKDNYEKIMEFLIEPINRRYRVVNV